MDNLLPKIANGDKTAFKDLYTLYSDKVYNTLISYTQNAQEAEDLTQEVFIIIFNKAGSFKGNSAESTWIYRIAVNTALNHIKKRSRFKLFTIGDKENSASDFSHPGILLEQKENASMLFKQLKTLPENQQSAFILTHIEDVSIKETAEILDLSYKAVESLIQRAKQNLRKKLENYRRI